MDRIPQATSFISKVIREDEHGINAVNIIQTNGVM